MPAARVRVYDAIRSAHLERFRTMTPATVVFAARRYDFDAALADDALDLRPMGRVATVRHLLTTRYETVELNEPLMTYRWLDLALQLTAVRLGARLRRQPVRIGAYCISLTDPAGKLGRRSRRRPPLPAPVATAWARLVLRLLVRGYDRLAFGTDATRELLGRYVPDAVLASRSRVFPALGAACGCTDGERDPGLVLFVGAFEERKGIDQVMQAWDDVHAARRELRLRMIGQGSRREDVERWASSRDHVTVTVDPPRADIHRAYREAHVVVLLSQRIGYWREQVGLPIVEALSHGCEVVSSDETGLAGWLAGHGHRVVDASAPPDVTARAIGDAAADRRTATDVLADLPAVDSRWAADRWLLTDDVD